MRIIYLTIITLFILMAFGCQSESKTEPPKKVKHIFAKYYVRYLQTENELKAEVSFKQGDTLATARSIILNEVSFEKNKMNIQNLGKSYGIRYGFRKKGPYSNQYDFQYTSSQSGPLEHTVAMEPITDFLIKEVPLEKRAGMTLIWQGSPLNADQEMVLLFTDEQKKAFPIQIKGPTERSELFFPAEKLSGLASGKGKLMLIKKQITQVEEENFTKTSELEFYSKNLDIEIKE